MQNVFSVILGLLILRVMSCMPWPRLPFATDHNWSEVPSFDDEEEKIFVTLTGS